MSGKRMEPAAPALQKHHHRRRRHTRIWPLAVGAAALAALVIGVWSLIAGYFILNPQPVLTLNGEKHERFPPVRTTPTPAHAPTAAAPT